MATKTQKTPGTARKRNVAVRGVKTQSIKLANGKPVTSKGDARPGKTDATFAMDKAIHCIALARRRFSDYPDCQYLAALQHQLRWAVKMASEFRDAVHAYDGSKKGPLPHMVCLSLPDLVQGFRKLARALGGCSNNKVLADGIEPHLDRLIKMAVRLRNEARSCTTESPSRTPRPPRNREAQR